VLPFFEKTLEIAMRLLKTLLCAILVSAVLAQAQTPQRPKTATAAKKQSATAKSTSPYYGGVDLGARGVKGELYTFVQEEEGPVPSGVFSKTVNTILVGSMKEGQFTKEGVADAASAVKQVVDAMKAEAEKRSLKVDSYYVVGSSGAGKATNKKDLEAAVKASAGIDMTWIDADHEGYYGLVSSVPVSRRATSMYMDIGSGNTKLGCIIGAAEFTNYKGTEIPFGASSGRNEALKRNPKDLGAGIVSLMGDITSDYEAKSRNIPCLRNRNRIYWTGGTAWATATFTHPEAALNGFVRITKQDLDAFRASLKDGTWNQKAPVFHFPKDMPIARQKEIRERADLDRNGEKGVFNVFVSEDLLTGVSIMESVLNSSNASAAILFVRNGNFLYGYALGQPGAETPK
jgi:hypothetical protein